MTFRTHHTRKTNPVVITEPTHKSTEMMTTSSQIWRNAVLLIATIVAVISTGVAEATTGTDSSCAAVLCPVNSTCKNGKCKLVCPPGYQNCNGKFSDGCEVNTKNGDVLNCGTCGAKCRKPKSYEFVDCVDGKCKYSDRCIAIKCATYPNSSTTCSKGKCRVTCNPGFGDCNQKLEIGNDGCEVDLNSDVNNCGKCGCKCGSRPFYGQPKCRKGVCGY